MKLLSGDSRQGRQVARQQAITEVVVAEGSTRIEQLADRFGVSLMTIHRDLGELEDRGILRKTRGVATATSTSLVESSDIYRASRQPLEKEAIALAALRFIEPGQAIFLDDSTTVLHIARHLSTKVPVTVITNALTLMNQLTGVRDLTLLGLGGNYYNWCNAFMGRDTTQTISQLRADTVIMSTSAITDDVTFHQFPETVDTKRAMFDASKMRILLVDHTKFERRALHALAPLSDFDIVIVDDKTPTEHIKRMRAQGINVVVAQTRKHDRASSTTEGEEQ